MRMQSFQGQMLLFPYYHRKTKFYKIIHLNIDLDSF